MVAVASILDERLHHSSVELAVLLDDATRTIGQRVLASLVALPSSVPVVLMADHGFRENPSWGSPKAVTCTAGRPCRSAWYPLWSPARDGDELPYPEPSALAARTAPGTSPQATGEPTADRYSGPPGARKKGHG